MPKDHLEKGKIPIEERLRKYLDKEVLPKLNEYARESVLEQDYDNMVGYVLHLHIENTEFSHPPLIDNPKDPEKRYVSLTISPMILKEDMEEFPPID